MGYSYKHEKLKHYVEESGEGVMILFLNFAPIEFLGGMERWILNISTMLQKKEETQIICMTPSIANIYGRVVLKSKFSDRSKSEIKDKKNISYLTVSSFIPFTKDWHYARTKFKQARIIYMKYEVLEIMILLYFLGINGLRKSIAGLHTPFLYQETNTFFERIHKFVYESQISKVVLSRMRLIHTINKRDEEFLQMKFRLTNSKYIPNGLKAPNIKRTQKTRKNILNILYVGELSYRKGVDILIDTVKRLDNSYQFKIIGEGYMNSEIRSLVKSRTNCTYTGYISNNKLHSYYRKNDVLFQPSRSEGMSLVVLEAISNGLPIVNSNLTSLDLPRYVEYTNNSQEIDEYSSIFKVLKNKKEKNKLDVTKIKRYFNKNFSEMVVNGDLSKFIFS